MTQAPKKKRVVCKPHPKHTHRTSLMLIEVVKRSKSPPRACFLARISQAAHGTRCIYLHVPPAPLCEHFSLLCVSFQFVDLVGPIGKEVKDAWRSSAMRRTVAYARKNNIERSMETARCLTPLPVQEGWKLLLV